MTRLLGLVVLLVVMVSGCSGCGGDADGTDMPMTMSGVDAGND